MAIVRETEHNLNQKRSHHRSRRPISSDSGYDTSSDGSLSPSSIRSHRQSVPSPVPVIDGPETQDPSTPNSNNLSSPTFVARTDLTESIGTQFSGIQLAHLDGRQLDELATLVSERGVVFFHNQELTPVDQVRIFDHYGTSSGKHIVDKRSEYVKIKNSPEDYGEKLTYVTGRRSEWTSERSFEINPPSFSMLKAEEAGGDTAWVSLYGLYDSLSNHMKGFLDGLEATHTSSLQYESIINLRGMPFDRAPVTIHHPAVRTHPVTSLKALDITPSAVTGFVDMPKKESDKILELLEHNINVSDELSVRFRWEAGSVAIWDNRCTALKHISEPLATFETSCIGEEPYLDRLSESRNEWQSRLVREAEQERIRLEEIQARYNDTPLRRILHKQSLIGEVHVDPQDSLTEKDVVQQPLTPRVEPVASGNETRKQSTVISKGSPLSRILHRQSSAYAKAR